MNFVVGMLAKDADDRIVVPGSKPYPCDACKAAVLIGRAGQRVIAAGGYSAICLVCWVRKAQADSKPTQIALLPLEQDDMRDCLFKHNNLQN